MSRMRRAMLVARTARHLRARQIVGRLRFMARPRPQPRRTSARWSSRGDTIVAALGALGPVDDEAAIAQRAASWRAGELEMLGRRLPAPRSWREASPTPLWAYHVHYHDALADLAWAARASGDAELHAIAGESLERWIDAWAAGGRPAWDAYPLAVRTVNWLRVLAWGSLAPDAVSRIRELEAAQADALRRSLEWHLDGNHLLRDAWALAIVPWCFEDPWGTTMGTDGRDLFWRCMREQIGADGVHEERSPMYHARTLRDALEVIAAHDAIGLAVPAEGRDCVRRMGDALRWMRHVDGSLRLINDSAGDHGVDLDRVARIAHESTGASIEPPEGLWWARGAGFAAIADGARGDRLFVDVGAPAPRHQPGHSHAGALGFELDLGGQPLVIDAGCSGYDADPLRPYFRGTSSHNTVVVDRLDQSEMWATFRVARRSRVDDVGASGDAEVAEIRGRCRPYHDSRIAHHRVLGRAAGVVAIDDRVEGADGRRVESFIHFDPRWEASREGDDTIALRAGAARAVVHVEGAAWTLHRGEPEPRRGWCAPSFGCVVPTSVIRIEHDRYDGRSWRTLIGPG